MQKEAALAALKVIDFSVYSSKHKELSPAEIDELQSACRSLVHSVKNNGFAADKAAWMVELIQAALVVKTSKPCSNRGLILEYGISLSVYIQGVQDVNQNVDRTVGYLDKAPGVPGPTVTNAGM